MSKVIMEDSDEAAALSAELRRRTQERDEARRALARVQSARIRELSQLLDPSRENIAYVRAVVNTIRTKGKLSRLDEITLSLSLQWLRQVDIENHSGTEAR